MMLTPKAVSMPVVVGAFLTGRKATRSSTREVAAAATIGRRSAIHGAEKPSDMARSTE